MPVIENIQQAIEDQYDIIITKNTIILSFVLCVCIVIFIIIFATRTRINPSTGDENIPVPGMEEEEFTIITE